MNDGLASVSTEDEAIQIVSEAGQLCSSGKLKDGKDVEVTIIIIHPVQRATFSEEIRSL